MLYHSYSHLTFRAPSNIAGTDTVRRLSTCFFSPLAFCSFLDSAFASMSCHVMSKPFASLPPSFPPVMSSFHVYPSWLPFDCPSPGFIFLSSPSLSSVYLNLTLITVLFLPSWLSAFYIPSDHPQITWTSNYAPITLNRLQLQILHTATHNVNFHTAYIPPNANANTDNINPHLVPPPHDTPPLRLPQSPTRDGQSRWEGTITDVGG